VTVFGAERNDRRVGLVQYKGSSVPVVICFDETTNACSRSSNIAVGFDWFPTLSDRLVTPRMGMRHELACLGVIGANERLGGEMGL
jgi:hypothetical protein